MLVPLNIADFDKEIKRICVDLKGKELAILINYSHQLILLHKGLVDDIAKEPSPKFRVQVKRIADRINLFKSEKQDFISIMANQIKGDKEGEKVALTT